MYVMMNGLGQTAAQAGAGVSAGAAAAAAPTKTTTVWEDILKAVPSVLDKVKDVLAKKSAPVDTPPPPPTYQPPPPPRTPGWVAPVAIGGGIVVLGVGTYALVRALGKRRR